MRQTALVKDTPDVKLNWIHPYYTLINFLRCSTTNVLQWDVTKTGNGEWGMGNGEWGMGNGEWGMGNGEWGMGNGEWGIEKWENIKKIK